MKSALMKSLTGMGFSLGSSHSETKILQGSLNQKVKEKVASFPLLLIEEFLFIVLTKLLIKKKK